MKTIVSFILSKVLEQSLYLQTHKYNLKSGGSKENMIIGRNNHFQLTSKYLDNVLIYLLLLFSCISFWLQRAVFVTCRSSSFGTKVSTLFCTPDTNLQSANTGLCCEPGC